MANDFYGTTKKQRKEQAKRQKMEAKKIVKINNIDTKKIEKTTKKVKKKTNKKDFKLIKVLNIIAEIIIVLAILIVIDVICVTKYNIGPFFAIKTKTYKDGGSEVYYGLFYKVIKYNQDVGRKDIELGSWNMPYSIEPLDTEMLDLAIEFRNNADKAYKIYAKKFLRLTGYVYKIDQKNRKVTLRFDDVDGSYTIDVECSMYSKDINLLNISEGDIKIVLGSVSNFKLKTKTTPNTLYLDNCFIN